MTIRIIKIILVVALGALLLAFAGFTVWAYTPLGPMPEALTALESDDQVKVETSPWLTFTPINENTSLFSFCAARFSACPCRSSLASLQPPHLPNWPVLSLLHAPGAKPISCPVTNVCPSRKLLEKGKIWMVKVGNAL